MATSFHSPPPASTTEADRALAQADAQADDQTVDLMELLVRFLAEWRTGLLVAVLVTAAGVAKTYSLKAQYVAQATILPQGGGASPLGGLAGLFSSRATGDVYYGLLGSRTVANDIIDRLHLMKVFGTSSRETAQKILAGSSFFAPGAGGIIIIGVRNTDAQLATDIANSYTEALGEQEDRMNFAEAARQQRFFETQLNTEREALAQAETALKKEQQTSGIIALETQTQIGLNTIAATRSQIQDLQVRLAALLQSATDQNPQVQTLRTQISALEGKEHALEASSGIGGVGAAPAAGRIPQLNLDVAHKERDVHFHDARVTSLSNAYEAARLSQQQSSPQYEVVDRAVVPEERSWPPRPMYLALAAGAGILAGLFAILVKLFLDRLRRSPEQVAHLRAIRQNFSLRRRRA